MPASQASKPFRELAVADLNGGFISMDERLSVLLSLTFAMAGLGANCFTYCFKPGERFITALLALFYGYYIFDACRYLLSDGLREASGCAAATCLLEDTDSDAEEEVIALGFQRSPVFTCRKRDNRFT